MQAQNPLSLSDIEKNLLIRHIVGECCGEMSLFLKERYHTLPRHLCDEIVKSFVFSKHLEISNVKQFFSQGSLDESIKKLCCEEVQQIIDGDGFFLHALMFLFSELGVSRPKGLREFIKKTFLNDPEESFKKKILTLHHDEFMEECNRIVLLCKAEETATLGLKSSASNVEALKSEYMTSHESYQVELFNIVEKKNLFLSPLLTKCIDTCFQLMTDKPVNIDEFQIEIRKALESITEKCQLQNQQYFTVQKEEINLLNNKLNDLQNKNYSDIEILSNKLNNQQSENDVLNGKLNIQREEIELLSKKLDNQKSEHKEELELLNKKLNTQQFENEVLHGNLKIQREEIELLGKKLNNQQSEHKEELELLNKKLNTQQSENESLKKDMTYLKNLVERKV